jgi:NADH dehydrogenase
MLKFVVIGGGPTGVELTAELEELVKESFSHYYPKEIIEDVSITLIQRGAELVPQFGTKIRKKSLETLQKKGVDVLLKTGVKEISASYAILDNDSKIFTETVIWVGGVKPAELNFEEAVPKTPDGKVLVNEYLQIKEYPEVFVIGDAAAFKQEGSDNFLPALAQVAEKESETVAKNIKLLMSGSPLEKFYYKSSGNLMSLGRWMAVGEIGGFSFSGHFAWWIWRTVYLSKLISLRKKMKVAIDWTMNIFSPRDISQI